MNLNRPGTGHRLVKEVMKTSPVLKHLTKQQHPPTAPTKPNVHPRSKFKDRD